MLVINRHLLTQFSKNCIRMVIHSATNNNYNNITIIILNIHLLPHYRHNDTKVVNWTTDIDDNINRCGCIWYSTSSTYYWYIIYNIILYIYIIVLYRCETLSKL